MWVANKHVTIEVNIDIIFFCQKFLSSDRKLWTNTML